MTHDALTRSEPIDTRGAALLALREACGGAVHLPGDAGYDAARQAWNVVCDQRPAAVAYPADAAEVGEVLRIAAAAGLRVAPQSTGHNATPLGDLTDVILLRLAGMTGVHVDPEARRVRVAAGALWLDVVEAAGAYGLAVLHGSSPDVGVVGYCLGGGMGWFARSLGLAANSVVAIEVVTADGRVHRVDADHEPELFWALRGGGGNFGVVTALELQLFAIETAYAGVLVWDWHRSQEVLERWAEWCVDAPDEVTTSFRILQLPPLETVPEPLRGRQVAMIDGAVLGDDALAERILAPLRALQPEMDTFGRQPAPALVRLHGDPEGPTPVVSDHAMLTSLPREAVTAFVAAAGADSGSTLVAAELRQLGGTLAREAAGAGALSRVDGSFALFALAVPQDAASAERGLADAQRVARAVQPWTNGRRYLNFAEHPFRTASAFPDATFGRLRAVQEQCDPYGLIVANHPLRAEPLPMPRDAG